MQSMTPDEIRAFLLDAPRTGILASVRADGRPHTAPIWFDMNGDDFMFTTWHTSVKAANLRRDSRVSLCVNDEKPPYAYVIIEGTAEFIDDPDRSQLKHWATRLAGRYMGADLAEQYGNRNSVEGELLLRLTPTHIIAHKNIAD